jgi:hypothetical protein
MSETTERTAYGPSKFQGEKFAPYALVLGQFAFAWNDYHEQLGKIFAFLTIGNAIRSLSAWGVISSDRTKRDVLLAAVGIADESFSKFPRLHEDVVWLVGVGTALEEHRNNIIHAPLTTIDNAIVAVLSKVAYGSVQPANPFNRRAARLTEETRGKDLLNELREYRDAASRYGQYADLIAKCLTTKNAPPPWPDRPLRLHHEKKPRNRGRRTVQE